MNKRPLIIIPLALLVMLTIPALAADSSKLGTFRKEIRKLYDIKEQAFQEDDPDKVVDEFYSKDVYSVGMRGDVHTGRESIRILANRAVPGSTIEIQSVKSHVNGDSG